MTLRILTLTLEVRVAEKDLEEAEDALDLLLDGGDLQERVEEQLDVRLLRGEVVDSSVRRAPFDTRCTATASAGERCDLPPDHAGHHSSGDRHGTGLVTWGPGPDRTP